MPIKNFIKARAHAVRPSTNSRKLSNFSANCKNPFYAMLNPNETKCIRHVLHKKKLNINWWEQHLPITTWYLLFYICVYGLWTLCLWHLNVFLKHCSVNRAIFTFSLLIGCSEYLFIFLLFALSLRTARDAKLRSIKGVMWYSHICHYFGYSPLLGTISAF